jgi:hypothetical protein
LFRPDDVPGTPEAGTINPEIPGRQRTGAAHSYGLSTKYLEGTSYPTPGLSSCASGVYSEITSGEDILKKREYRFSEVLAYGHSRDKGSKYEYDRGKSRSACQKTKLNEY